MQKEKGANSSEPGLWRELSSYITRLNIKLWTGPAVTGGERVVNSALPSSQKIASGAEIVDQPEIYSALIKDSRAGRPSIYRLPVRESGSLR
ncbi:hypothetical protein EVAR_31106_1 [Eumeta japonica]|uniref:Uncharacterized protein n=1 Tax=Eumeta variegata TaxID=151549 RepID=A0A4C1VHF1_EUMVA|nr:hypothetical protein EVAR_31106_1 [Eumeta japonica]